MHEPVNSITLYAVGSCWGKDVSQTALSQADGGLSVLFMQSRQRALRLAACIAHVHQAETRHAPHA